MNIGDLPGFLEDELQYPIDQASVLEQIGATEIRAPDRQKSETVSTIVGSVGLERYDSAQELFETIYGNVSDEYIGRKFYDDRSGNAPETSSEPRDEGNMSF